MNKGVGARIKFLRERRDWSQIELANKIGMSNSVLSRIEAGLRKTRADELEKIAAAFNTSPDYILGNPDHQLIVHTSKNKGAGADQTSATDSDSEIYLSIIKEIETQLGITLNKPEDRENFIKALQIVKQIQDLKSNS